MLRCTQKHMTIGFMMQQMTQEAAQHECWLISHAYCFLLLLADSRPIVTNWTYVHTYNSDWIRTSTMYADSVVFIYIQRQGLMKDWYKGVRLPPRPR